jgi:hypothetical protein
MAYKILGNDTLTALETQVNEYRKKGFEPCGSIFTHDDNRCGRCVFQPMLKLHPNKPLKKEKVMRKANTLGGCIDRLEYNGTELQLEIIRLKDINRISPTVFNSLSNVSNVLGRYNLAMRSLKRILTELTA